MKELYNPDVLYLSSIHLLLYSSSYVLVNCNRLLTNLIALCYLNRNLNLHRILNIDFPVFFLFYYYTYVHRHTHLPIPIKK